MPRAEVGTPKFIANKMKSKGLQRLRWYCQVCEKQCRDENGYKCHAASESHLRQMLVVGENAGRHITNYSMEFQSSFVALLSRTYGTNRVRANQVYQAYIADKDHIHMNSTRWVTLTEFIKTLGRAGIARVDETEKGWFIAWIDNSPKALAKAEASQKRERATVSDEQRERLLIAEQIERASAEAGPSTSSDPVAVEKGLNRDEGAEKVVLSFSAKAPSTTPAAAPTVATGLKFNALKPAANPLKANPLKRANVFKAGSSFSAASEQTNDKKRPASSMGAAQRLIIEEQERKKRRMDRDGTA
ncbi:domain of Kin17 curved DNA-binding protein-domain-containing protein [Mycena floridula]|nr:domain of Kin17 curved DNA-binding protein-domain-containing protein [Mycena floridula]